MSDITRILVTGGAALVGATLVRRLAASSYWIRDRYPAPAVGRA